MIDLVRVRADTPGCESIAHFNNSGSSLPPRRVVDMEIDYLRAEERMGGYETETLRHDDPTRVYHATARMLGCDSREVAFTSNASDAWWRAFSSIPLVAGDRVLTGRSEFQTGGFGLLQARERGVIVDVIPNGDNGDIDLVALDAALADDVKAIVFTQISMSNGAVQPAAEVGERARSIGASTFLTLARPPGRCRWMSENSTVIFSCSQEGNSCEGRGRRGSCMPATRSSIGLVRHPSWTDDPQTGYLQTSINTVIEPDISSSESRTTQGRRGWALPSTTPSKSASRRSPNESRALAGRLRHELPALAGVVVRDEGTVKCGIVTFTVDDHSPVDVRKVLSRQGINVSAPGRRNAQFDLGGRGLDIVVRAGVHYFNTDEEIDRLVAAVASL